MDCNYIAGLLGLFIKLLKHNGVRDLAAENAALRQQLIVLSRNKIKCPPLKNRERIFLAILTLFLSPKRLKRSAILISESTLLKFHKAMVNWKYSRLFRNKSKKKPGPKGPSRELIQFIVEIKEKNPRYGSPKIAYLASQVLCVTVDESLVRRILKRYYRPLPGGEPSWLAPIGYSSGKLWSLDLFRVETMSLKSLWVMVVIDQFTRRIIGFKVHAGDLTGGVVCFMFNQIIARQDTPTYLSTDNDPLFNYWLWASNLEQMRIREVKSVPYVPWSHPFIERQILSVRTELTDHILIWSKADLEEKLSLYQEHFNEYRVHYALEGKTPSEMNGDRKLATIELQSYRWKLVCGGLFQTPLAA